MSSINIDVARPTGIYFIIERLYSRDGLMPKLYLEAVSGVDQALDLLYQFEF